MDMISSEPTQKVVVSFDEGSDHNQADAEFILRAVNCHDELAEALRYWLPDETQIPAGHTKAWHEAVNLLAKVQGK